MPTSATRPVRLITFNTHHAVGADGRHDLPRLATVLAAAEADVVCLQEVDRHFGDRSEGVDQATLLAHGLDMNLAWGPAIDEPPVKAHDRRQYGNALLTRLPIRSSEVVPLPGGGEPRTVLRTTLQVDDGALEVTTTHLSTRSADERAAQAAVLAALPTGGPAVLAGDFNAEPDAPELAVLHELFRDGWELARSRTDRAGWRFWRHDEGHTHPARHPRSRIDQVWVAGGIDVAGASVLDAGGASDHLPLVVDLEVPTAAARG